MFNRNQGTTKLVVNEKPKSNRIMLSQVIAYCTAAAFIALSAFFFFYLQGKGTPAAILYEGVEYSFRGEGLAVSGLASNANLSDLVIPAEVKGFPVVYIGELINCRNVKRISVPASVAEISANAFERAESLELINVDGENRGYSSAEGILYSKDFSRLIKFPVMRNNNTLNTSLGVEEGVEEICPRAFFGAMYLRELYLPESLTNIGDMAFEGCASLSRVSLFDGVKRMGDRAFYRCSSLLSFELPAEIEYIGEACFLDCPLFTLFALSDDNAVYTAIDGVLYSVDKTRLIAYPVGARDAVYSADAKTEHIGAYAFSSNAYLKKLILPEGLTEIGLNAFERCAALKMVVINSLAVPEVNAVNVFSYEINYYVPTEMLSEYEKKSEWKNAYAREAILPAFFNLTESGAGDYSYIFGDDGVIITGYSGADDAVIPDCFTVELDGEVLEFEVTAFSVRSFNSNTLKSVVLNGLITTVPAGAFRKFANLEEVVFSPALEYIEPRAFADCPRLASLIFLELETEEGSVCALSEIGDFAFANCASLNAVTLPRLSPRANGALALGEGVFERCFALKTVYLFCKAEYAGKNPNGLIAPAVPAFVLVVADEELRLYFAEPSHCQRWSILPSEVSARIVLPPRDASQDDERE